MNPSCRCHAALWYMSYGFHFVSAHTDRGHTLIFESEGKCWLSFEKMSGPQFMPMTKFNLLPQINAIIFMRQCDVCALISALFPPFISFMATQNYWFPNWETHTLSTTNSLCSKLHINGVREWDLTWAHYLVIYLPPGDYSTFQHYGINTV